MRKAGLILVPGLVCAMCRYNDDDFNWNHGISLAATGNYKAAEVPTHYKYRQRVLIQPPSTVPIDT